MNRRELLKYSSVVLGFAVSASLSRAVLAKATPSSAHPGSLTAAQLITVSTLCELIIPATDTPGANAAGVHRFVDHICSQWFTASERSEFIKGLNAFSARCINEFDTEFKKCAASQQRALMTIASDESMADDSKRTQLGRFFRSIKELTVLGYYTSEIGSKQERIYRPVPMRYKGDVLYSDVGRRWSY